MSMAALLESVQDHLRTELAIGDQFCGVQLDGEPPPVAGEFYVAIDEGGINAPGGTEDWLLEQFTVVVSIMRRSGQYMKDRKANLLKREASSIKGLEELERRTIRALHGRHDFRIQYNILLGVPDESLGEMAVLPLWYRGRSRTYSYVNANEEPAQQFAWLRRDLRFAGLDRKQKLENLG